MVGQLTMVLSPILGYISDRYGAKVLANTMALTCWLGLALILVAAGTGVDQFLYVAFGILTLATLMGTLLTVQTGLYFTGKMQSRVIFALNALFDSGSITYLALWGIGEWTGASIQVLIGGYLVVAVLVFGGAVYFWNVAVPEEEEGILVARKNAEAKANEEKAKATKDDAAKKSDAEAAAKKDATVETSVAVPTTAKAAMKENTTENDDRPGKKYIVVQDRQSRQQLTSAPFLLLVLFFSFHNASTQWNLSTQRDFLAYLGDDEQGNKYLTIFTLLMPASIVGLPFVDMAIIRYGFAGSFQGVNLFALAYSVIKVRGQ
jgi:hypothetical protein